MGKQLFIPYWYNTLGETGIKLEGLKLNGKHQEIIIMSFFMGIPDQDLTPCEVHQRLMLSCPLTSCRRAMTNLTKRGILIKTESKRKGIYGKDNYTWQLSDRIAAVDEFTRKEFIRYFKQGVV
jgi:hypothetical protein